jgi:hypothetical protein
MTRMLLMAKIAALVAATFAVLEAGFLLHETRVDIAPVFASLGKSLIAATTALDEARQTGADVDAEVNAIRKPPSKPMKIICAIAKVAGKFVL